MVWWHNSAPPPLHASYFVMQDKYLNMQGIYANMQDINVNMQDKK